MGFGSMEEPIVFKTKKDVGEDDDVRKIIMKNIVDLIQWSFKFIVWYNEKKKRKEKKTLCVE